ncbi:MAG: radical SAM/SPASM domain-containing protein [Dehalococcoidia bacterium]
MPEPFTPTPLPVELYLEVTNRCNLKCTTCPQSWGMEEEEADLSPDRVREFLDQLPRVDRVVLHGIGEPTLNPDLVEILRLVKARGAYALFNSNGLLLRGKLARELVEAGLDEARISIDAAEASTYLAVRGADVFDRVLANAAALTRVRDQLGSATPRVSLWMTGLKMNIAELPALVRVAAASGIKEVYLQRLVFSGRGNALEEQALFGRVTEDEEQLLADAVALGASLGVTLRGSQEALPKAEAPSAADAPWRGCWRPFRLMYITANGNALPCCMAPFTAAPYAGLVLGNVFANPISEVWEGDRYDAWRQRMQEGEPNEACARCGSDWAL